MACSVQIVVPQTIDALAEQLPGTVGFVVDKYIDDITPKPSTIQSTKLSTSCYCFRRNKKGAALKTAPLVKPFEKDQSSIDLSVALL